MRQLIAVSLLAGAFLAPPAPAEACSIAGRWCGYPPWAANAFEDPRARVNLNSGPNLPRIGPEAGGYSDRAYAPAPRPYAQTHRRKRR